MWPRRPGLHQQRPCHQLHKRQQQQAAAPCWGAPGWAAPPAVCRQQPQQLALGVVACCWVLPVAAAGRQSAVAGPASAQRPVSPWVCCRPALPPQCPAQHHRHRRLAVPVAAGWRMLQHLVWWHPSLPAQLLVLHLHLQHPQHAPPLLHRLLLQHQHPQSHAPAAAQARSPLLGCPRPPHLLSNCHPREAS